MKQKTRYSCSECGATFSQWAGQCNQCGVWNSLTEETLPEKSARRIGYAGESSGVITPISHVSLTEGVRVDTGMSEFNRALGGGLVAGSVVLIGGDPGIGKSTLLLQVLVNLSQHTPVLYVTGEESLQQVSLRANRINLPADKLKLLAETQVARILALVEKEKPAPQVLVIDSIQTIYSENISSAPGSVSQVRESAAQLVRYAKATGAAVFLVGHVTKEGTLAGPRVLEHMVDTVLYFEGERDGRFRLIRAFKNRFGAVNEVGVFGMTDKGLKEVSNPSAMFLSRPQESMSGSMIMVTWEGSRPILVEVQALVDTCYGSNPRRLTVGLDQNRLVMLLAVLHRHGGVVTYDQDVFVNVIGGVRVLEPAVDLAIVLAALSSLKNRPLEKDWVVFGEIGLAGEIRPVLNGQERLQEALKHGFKRAIIPYANAPKKVIPGLTVYPVKHLQEALTFLA
jgi:DNA repair protein RadA/Sms